ncbi:MAG: flagellar filament capping protein FliD [Candidatus Zixiibacteriota bacterium]|nr:MAG: flagellar filament capping protein FliD [candidate division Zixibacteria bacterium]
MPALNSITGINSGLDTVSIVDTIIAFERQNAALLEQQQAEKQSIISAYQALQAKFLGLNTALSQLTRVATFEKSSISVSDSSILSATASGRVSSGSYDVQVLSLARNHQLASQGFSDEALASFGTGDITIQVGEGSQYTVTIDATNNSMVGIKNAINDADMGVTASIINDGSSSNPYRLLLSADNPGAANKMTVTSNLSGGNNLDFATSSFDSPETVTTDSGSTSQISLGATAAYTGSENKIYTFTVAGTGAQTIGSDNITINWSDGTNSGSIVVTQADTEVELVGDGADGLTLTFSAGVLTAGDIFQVNTFSPLLQEASDARITLGSSGGGGSPIIVQSVTNTFNDLVGGLSITVAKETAPGESVTINTDLDISGIKEKISTFIARYNELNEYIDDQNTYDKEADEAGMLFGDITVWTMQNKLRRALGSTIPGIEGQFNQLYSIGIRTTATGELAITDSARLENALRNNLDDVISLFAPNGSSSTSFIEFVSSSSETMVGTAFDVDITQAASQGGYQGVDITDPSQSGLTLTSTGNRLRLTVDGVTSDEIILAAKTYQTAAELVTEIQGKIDSDAKIGSRDVTVEWVSTGATTGYLQFTGSTYGSGSKIELVTEQSNSAYASLGLSGGQIITGLDVAGTINGEEAEGAGQFLTGKEGNATTEGLKIRVTLDESQVQAGIDGSITITKGVAARLKDFVESVTRAGDGTFDRRIRAYQNQIESIAERVADIDERLELRRQALYKQFYEMELILGQLSAQSEYLTNQLAGINVNWKGYTNNR